MLHKLALAQIKDIRTKMGLTVKQVQEATQKLFSTDKVQELNPTMGQALISYLQNNGGNGGSEY